MILKALLFINGFALVIGLLIVVLDKLVSRYGQVRIVINDDKEFTATGGKSLLRLLFENKYFIPSACGGKGTCGYCRVKVREGGGPALPTESLILTSREIRDGYRLACQLKVRKDLEVEIPPEYLEIQEYEGEVVTAEPVTPDIKRLDIKLLDPDQISFKPGQYVQVKFDTDSGPQYRAYSIASSPDRTHQIQLNVKLIPEGLGSSYLHAREVGDRVQLSGPYGDFFLNVHSQRKIVCIAGGVGLAPMRAIVLYWRDHLTDRPIELYYGSRTREHLYDHELFAELAASHEKFRYCPALSEDDPSWDGEQGFIHTVLADKLEDGVRAEGYLCGPQIMIDAATEVLLDKGVPPERISYDKF